MWVSNPYSKMLTKLNLSEEEILRLNHERYHHPSAKVQKKMHIIYIKATQSGISNTKIGDLLGIHRNTVSSCIHLYLKSGIEGLCKNNYHPSSGILDYHAATILTSLTDQPVCSINEAVDRIKDLTGIQRKPTTVRRFLHKQGFRYRKMGSIPGKVNPEKQKEWVEDILNPYIKQAQENHLHLFFSDAAHFTLSSFVCMIWSICRIFLKTSHGRNRINVLGAIDAVTKDVTTLINTTYITAETIMEFLRQLKVKYPEKPIAIIMDNAKYQRCEAVQKVAEKLNITLIFLPPYSPNLNIIERLWKFTKKKVLYAKYYSKAEDFHNAIEKFFCEINENYKEDLQKLMTLKFQMFEQDNIAQECPV